jgi:hypothetical protein
MCKGGNHIFKPSGQIVISSGVRKDSHVAVAAQFFKGVLAFLVWALPTRSEVLLARNSVYI